ncbi:MAG TPA: hypothetical protein VG917_01745 [Patescibacteria group bacterium]|nr:hypothetical protein [Patescibacteria group bacterium]
MAKSKNIGNKKLYTFVALFLGLILGFLIGMKFEKNKTVAPIPVTEVKNPLSEPAMLTKDFYTKYVDCWNNTIGKKPESEWNCDSIITTHYFTQKMIDSMSGRTKAYCGYESPETIYVTEGKQYGNTADVVVWGKYVSDVPTIIHLSKTDNWHIDGISCEPQYYN